MDKRVEFGTFAVGGRNNERADGVLGLVLGYRCEAFALVRDLDDLAAADWERRSAATRSRVAPRGFVNVIARNNRATGRCEAVTNQASSRGPEPPTRGGSGTIATVKMRGLGEKGPT